MALALPTASTSASATAPSPRKTEKKRKRKDKEKEYDSDAELEVSAEDLVAADAEGEGDAGGVERTGAEGEEDDDEDVGAAPPTSVAVGVQAKRRKEQTLMLRGILDPDQARRFDAFHGVVIPRAAIKKLNRDLYDQHIPPGLTAVVAGMVKVFVADVVEKAKELQPDSKVPRGPLQPYHLQLARMELQRQGMLAPPASDQATTRSSTGLRPRKRLFRR